MSLMNKIEIISDKVNEMKSKLGLPMSASLQNIVDNMDMGGDAYLGLLPNNATIDCVASGDCGITVTVKGVPKEAAGVRVYWQKGSIPAPYEGNVLDFPAGTTSQTIPNLEVDTVYGFRCATYIIVNNRRVYNNAQNSGAVKLCRTLFINENIVMIDLPEICQESTYHMNYSIYSNTIYLVSNNKFYKLNKDYTWEVIWDAAAENITISNYMFISSHGVFVTNSSYSSNTYIMLYKEDTGKLINTNMKGCYFNEPFETTKGEVFARAHTSYDNRNGIYLFDPDTNTWSNSLVNKCTGWNHIEVEDGVYFVTSTYNSGNQAVYKYDSINKKMITLHDSTNIPNVADSYNSFKRLENGMIVWARGASYAFFILHNDTVYAGGLKSSGSDRFYYDAATNTIYYSDESEYLCKIHEDLISRTRISTKACWVKSIVYNDRLYMYRASVIIRLNEDGTLTEITGQNYNSNDGYDMFIGADGWLYYNSDRIYAINTSTNKGIEVKKGTSSFYTSKTYHITANGNTYISAYSSRGADGLYLLKEGNITATGITISREWTNVNEVDSSHCIVVSTYNNTENTNEQYLLNTDNQTAEKLLNVFGGTNLYQGRFFLNNPKNMIYGYGEALYPVCTVDLSVIDVGNPYFRYAAQVNNVGLQAVLVNTFVNLVLLKGRVVQQYADDVYQEKGYRAFNNAGDDITEQVVVDTSELNTQIPGTYSVLYSVEADGTIYKDTRTVQILDPYEWTNTLSNTTLLTGDTYTPPTTLLYRKNNDKTLTDISEHVVMTHNIDYATPGNYEVTFSCNYIYGIETTKTILVTILRAEDVCVANYNTAVDTVEGGLVTTITKSGNRSLITSKYISAPSSLYGSSGYVDYTLPSLKEFDITINFYKADSASYSRLCYLVGPNREIEIKNASNDMYIGQEISGGWLQNKWNKLRITRNSNNLITYYMNGNQIHTETNTALLTRLRVGCGDSTSSNVFNGYIDDVIIINSQPKSTE